MIVDTISLLPSTVNQHGIWQGRNGCLFSECLMDVESTGCKYYDFGTLHNFSELQCLHVESEKNKATL